jgi:hypothetical protein
VRTERGEQEHATVPVVLQIHPPDCSGC